MNSCTGDWFDLWIACQAGICEYQSWQSEEFWALRDPGEIEYRSWLDKHAEKLADTAQP